MKFFVWKQKNKAITIVIFYQKKKISTEINKLFFP